MKHLGLKILPFAILLANCDNGDDEQDENASDPQDTQSKKNPQNTKQSQDTKPDDPQTSDDPEKTTTEKPEKTIEEAIEELEPTFKILKTIDFEKIAQASHNSDEVNLDSLSQEHKDALDNLDRFFGENYETIKSNFFRNEKFRFFWEKGIELSFLGCISGKLKNVVKFIAKETKWIRFICFSGWNKSNGEYFLENCDLETIKLWYEKNKDDEFYFGGFPPKGNKGDWYRVMIAVFQNPDLEITKFIVDLYPEVMKLDVPSYISNVLNDLIPFKDKPSYSFLDEKLAWVEIKNEQCKYLLEKYPDYKLPPEVLYIRLANKKDNSEILRTLLGRFDQWEEFANKCCESYSSKAAFLVKIAHGINFEFLKKFAQEKGVDLVEVLQKGGLLLV